jgi:primosomal protein N' (replication factor Y) (superfamily II helicase)
VAVCVDRPLLSLDRAFTYLLSDELQAGVGTLVQVPFHGKLTRGWILGSTADVPPRTLPVRKMASPIRFFDERQLELFRWMSERYVAPLATVIARSHPPRVVSEEQAGWKAGPAPDEPLPPREAGPLQRYRGGLELGDALGSGGGGTFVLRPIPEQEQEILVESVRSTLAGGRSALVLVPEADPLPATAAALVDAFGPATCVYAGGDRRRRYRTWLDIAAGRFTVVVGTRPAVFAPLRDLGLMWVARESHPGHREERSPYYHVRDVALARCQIEGAVCVMAALCPSAEAAGIPAHPVEPSARAWPPVEVVRPGPQGRAPRLVAALKQARRAFLYEPLPGYGVARVCRSCGEPARCSSCAGTLRLEAGAVRCTVCHAPGRCGVCGSGEFGVSGTGTERVAEWAARAASAPVRQGPPRGRGIAVGGPEAVRDLGPLALDLVGILDADLAARRPGLAAMEQSLAVWMEASGWARPSGRVIVQTTRPNDPAVQSLVAGNPERFHRAEAARREQAGFPPGSPVFRVAGHPPLAKELETLAPLTLLTTGSGDETICLVTVRPADVADFGRAMRRLAEAGTVTRVEAEPHL